MKSMPSPASSAANPALSEESWPYISAALPNAAGGPLGFFMYPQAETGAGRKDCLDPETFRYRITSREPEPPPPTKPSSGGAP